MVEGDHEKEIDPVTKGDMQEFIIFWRLKDGPRSEEELLEHLMSIPEDERANVLSGVLDKLVERKVVRYDMDQKKWELTDEGSRFLKVALDTFSSGMETMIENSMIEEFHEGEDRDTGDPGSGV